MNNDIAKLKRLDIWSNFIKIKDILEPCYAFFLKDSGYRLYVTDYGDGEIDKWWCGKKEQPNGERQLGDLLGGPTSFDEVFDSADERMKEKFVFNMDILV